MTVLASLALATVQYQFALQGHDPVELCKGTKVAGNHAIATSYQGFTYTFKSQANRKVFVSNPDRWGIQIGGACGNMGPLSGRGAPNMYSVHDGKIWIFASEQCQKAFEKEPTGYVDGPDSKVTPNPSEKRSGLKLMQETIAAHHLRPATIVWVMQTAYKDGSGKQAFYYDNYGYAKDGKLYKSQTWDGGGAHTLFTGSKTYDWTSKSRYELGQQEDSYFKRLMVQNPVIALLESEGASVRGLPSQLVAGYGPFTGFELNHQGANVKIWVDPKTHLIGAWETRERTGGPYRPTTKVVVSNTMAGNMVLPEKWITIRKGAKSKPSVQKFHAIRVDNEADTKLFVLP